MTEKQVAAYIEEEYPGYEEYDAYDMEYIMQRRDAHPNVYKSSLYRQVDEPKHSSIMSLLNRNKSSSSGSSQTNLYNYNAPSRNSNYGPLFFNLVNNPIILILLVVVVSYLIAFIFGNLLGVDASICGLIEMIVALLLSYGLSFYTERNSDFIVKGTFVFFISLIILIILIFI